ncbi:hypothetical protein GEMRC1_008524 [Eukaryota sp. GEM-RC1]
MNSTLVNSDCSKDISSSTKTTQSPTISDDLDFDNDPCYDFLDYLPSIDFYPPPLSDMISGKVDGNYWKTLPPLKKEM